MLREGDQRRAVVLGVASLELSRTVLSQALPIDDEGIAWLDPSTTSNLRIGLAETRAIADPPVGT